MKSKLLKELQQEVSGHVTDAPDALEYFSTDCSLFQIRPTGAFYPEDTRDVRKAVAFAAAARAEGKDISITARGKGTDLSGGALGDGLMVVFPAHMNKILKMDKDTVTIQPGTLYDTLQEVLHTHGRFCPAAPSSADYCTVGGAVANNASGEKTLKYGATRDFVKSLKVVLADGSLIETKRISARELHRKKGLMTLEGEIYRAVDRLVEENHELIKKAPPRTTKNSSGYALWQVKHKDGSFDLSQLIIGSQGTLGVITEITLKTLPYNPKTTLLVGYFDDMGKAGEAVVKLLHLGPSVMELVDHSLLDFLLQNHPEFIDCRVPDKLPKAIILTEFDEVSVIRQGFKARSARKIIQKYAPSMRISTDIMEQTTIWKIRHSAAALAWMSHGKEKALPIIEDGVVPVEKLPEFLKSTHKLLEKYGLQGVVWGHAGNANLHVLPFLDLGKTSDREKVFELADDFYKMVIKLGGSTSGEHNDGLIRAPYLGDQYGPEVYELFRTVKQIFDPRGLLNPRVKLDVTTEDLKPLLRQEYSMKHLYDHLPHT